MTLNEYLSAPGAPTVTEFRQRMADLGYEVKSNAQIRQWRYAYKDRLPDAKNCMGIHLASDKKIALCELRPDDWQSIWPQLAQAKNGVIDRAAASDDTQPLGGSIDPDDKLAKMM
ncbi:hypothetical protein [Paraburkholderia nemoris]|uniref:hypothetical protein n=1 Tax=Paraburkholderia nemoris TaxID=2793076 RepID=UPI001B0FB7D6|nr:hypothetical protein [Paraburkholderia nemoris]CAE6839005.1 hypothetical protein R75777_06976 [Paraburkholderia nemoris]